MLVGGTVGGPWGILGWTWPKVHGPFPAGVVLPEGLIVKRADLGATSRFRVARGIEYDHSGQYMAVGPFEYASK